jgi:RIO kinase 1
MVDPLAPLLADGVIDEVVARLKSGKEADLWLVRHGGETIAAKVYKARETRSFKNNAGYLEGRRVRDSRTQRAMDRGSRFGQAAAEEAWKAKEADALFALHAAGVRVPRPVTFYDGVLLMELVLDAHGNPAPRLIDAHVERADAARLYGELRASVIRMLGCDLVHGDLSPYNVLLGHDGPVIIDFPQVVGAAHNSQAERFFERDLENLRRHLAGLDPALDAASGDAREIWRAYVRRELTPDFVPSGKPPPEPVRRGGGAGPRQRPAAGGPRPRDTRAAGPRSPSAETPRPQGAGRAHPQTASAPHPQSASAPHPQSASAPHPQSASAPHPQNAAGARPQKGPRPQDAGAPPHKRAAPQAQPERRRTPEVIHVVRPPASASRPQPPGRPAHAAAHPQPRPAHVAPAQSPRPPAQPSRAAQPPRPAQPPRAAHAPAQPRPAHAAPVQPPRPAQPPRAAHAPPSARPVHAAPPQPPRAAPPHAAPAEAPAAGAGARRRRRRRRGSSGRSGSGSQ